MSSDQPPGDDCFEELIRQLRNAGHAAAADKLDVMLHQVAWTTGSEMVGELGLEILAFQRSASEVSRELQRSLNRCMLEVRRIWPDIK